MPQVNWPTHVGLLNDIYICALSWTQRDLSRRWALVHESQRSGKVVDCERLKIGQLDLHAGCCRVRVIGNTHAKQRLIGLRMSNPHFAGWIVSIKFELQLRC